RRFTEYLNPRAMRVVALPVPTEEERGQWYFQRYIKQLPNRGEVVFFDRSWYNRAVVEPVNGFGTQEQYERFLRQVPEFEHVLFSLDYEGRDTAATSLYPDPNIVTRYQRSASNVD